MNDDLISRAAAIECLEHLSACDEPFVEIGTDDETFIRKYEAITEISDLPSAQPEIIRCKDCKHKPYPSDNYDYDNGDNGFEIIFPDYRCPCRCEDDYYNRIPDDDWFCGNAERRTDEGD